MAAPTVYALHGISTPTQFLSQIESASPSPAITALLGAPSGHPQPMFRGVKGLKPVVPFTTTQLATLFAGGVFFADLSAGNTDISFRKLTNLGTRELLASSLHTRIRLNKAFLVVGQIQARAQQEATAQAQLLAVYDGTNNPMAATGSVALAGTPAASEFFHLGPVKVNGSTLEGATEVSIDPGFQLLQLATNTAYDTFVGIKTSDPTVTIRGVDISPWTAYAPTIALSSLTVYLRKLTADGASGLPYVADATGAHVKFTATNGIITLDSTQSGGQNEATTGIKIYLRAADAASDALGVAVSQAIT